MIYHKKKNNKSIAPDNRPNGLTLRCFIIGLLLSLFISIAAPYCDLVTKGSYMTVEYSTAGAVFLFMVLVGLINALLRRIKLNFSLSRSELLIVYLMMTIACSIVTMGFTIYLLPILVAPFYFATPENNWVELIQPYIPRWMAPRDLEVSRCFFEGLSKGESIPWQAWARPLICWGSFILVLYFVTICMMVILRKQWVERERLIFPLTRLPLELAEEPRKGSVINSFLKNRLMWLGFAIPFLLSSWNCFHNYFHFIPKILLLTPLEVSFPGGAGSLTFTLNFVVIGLMYLVSSDIALSLWFFNLLGTLQSTIFNRIGFTIGRREVYCASSASVSQQGMGAMIVLVILGLWMARSHLKEVFKKAFTNKSNLDDSNELLSYRVACFGMISGLIFIFFWLKMSGLSFFHSLIFLFGGFIILLGLTRIVCAAGVAHTRAPLIPQYFTIHSVGSSALGPAGLISLGFSFIWIADIRTLVMTSVANGLKLLEGIRMRKIFWAVMAAILISLVGSIWITLRLCYSQGGLNLSDGWFLNTGARYPFEYMANKIQYPVPVSKMRYLFTGIGALFMAFLMFMRNRFLWWPIHYIGFPIGNTFVLQSIWFSIFIAWLLKALILKYAGVKAYRRFLPMFLGLVLGQISCAGVWLIIDQFTKMVGNRVLL